MRSRYQNPSYMGEYFYITEIYSLLNKRVRGIIDVKDVEVFLRTGANYSDTKFSIEKNLSPDGRYLAIPENVAVEIKFLQSDIKGTIM